MKITKKTLVLGFTNGLGKGVNLTINDPIEGLEGAAVASAMDEIIASGAFGEDSLVSKKVEAKYVIQQVDEIALAD